jgi:hypothetical protein
MLRDDMRKVAEEDDPKKSAEEQAETVTEGVGGLMGFATGAAAGLALGPVGAVIGALAGGAGGWWAGKQVGDAALEFEDRYFRRIHAASDARSPSYEDVRHAYQLGHLAGRNPEYGDAGFDAIEPELRHAWKKAHGGSDNWDQVRPCVDRGFTHAREEPDNQRE